MPAEAAHSELTIEVDGRPVAAVPGQTVAAALLGAGDQAEWERQFVGFRIPGRLDFRVRREGQSLDVSLQARELLPADWPRAQARELFLETYEQLGAPASVRVRQVIASYAPELSDRVVQFSLVSDPPGPRPAWSVVPAPSG